MQLGLLPLLGENPLAFVVVLTVLALAFTLHEFAHAWTADRFGDPTPRSQGRVTLNPAMHLDPFGLLMIVLVGFGYARPVLVDTSRMTAAQDFLVAAAGPLSHVVIAAVAAAALRMFGMDGLGSLILLPIIFINIMLAVINLLPLPGLDGSRMLAALVPPLRQPLREFESQPLSFLLVIGFFVLLSPYIGGLIRTVQSALIHLVFAV